MPGVLPNRWWGAQTLNAGVFLHRFKWRFHGKNNQKKVFGNISTLQNRSTFTVYRVNICPAECEFYRLFMHHFKSKHLWVGFFFLLLFLLLHTWYILQQLIVENWSYSSDEVVCSEGLELSSSKLTYFCSCFWVKIWTIVTTMVQKYNNWLFDMHILQRWMPWKCTAMFGKPVCAIRIGIFMDDC